MKTYDVTLLGNGVYQSNLVKTDKSPIEIGQWFKENKPNKSVLSINIATSDSMKPGKPIIIIE